jgi:hypothetical protein
MATNPTPYIPRNPGDTITAGDWNAVQIDIKNDIASQVQTAVGNVKSVDHAKDADTLGGQTPDQLTQAILKLAEEILPKRTGYFRSYNRLETGKETVLKHGLKSFPLVDIYQLDYFQAICAKSETELAPSWVNFFLYHTSERTITVKVNGASAKAVIEAQDQQAFRLPFADMIAQYQVQLTDSMTLDEVETAFWTAFWKTPNDQFDADQYCHSPWFEKCCGEKRSYKDLKDRNDWSNIWFKMIPRKTINYPTPPPVPAATDPSVAPTQIQVAHHDFDSTGIKLLLDPVYPQSFLTDPTFVRPDSYLHELKIMVLAKV